MKILAKSGPVYWPVFRADFYLPQVGTVQKTRPKSGQVYWTVFFTIFCFFSEGAPTGIP